MTRKPQRKKRQHYVPQQYLKKFSTVKNISGKEECLYAYSFKTRGCCLENVKDLCKKDFFYGKDDRSQKFENGLSQFEQRHSEIIQKIIDTHSIDCLNKDEYIEFLLFLLLQDARTKRSQWEIREFTQVMVENVIKPQLKLKERPADIPEDFIDKLDIKFSGDFALRMLGAICYVEGLSDLKVILINNTTERNFYCSDHPVVRYNYIEFEDSTSLDYLAPGLLIFFPLNNENLVLLFDEKAYSVDVDFGSVYCLNNTTDLDSINKLQFINAFDCVLFSDGNEIANVKKMHADLQRYISHEYHIERKEILHNDGSKTLVMHHVPEKSGFKLNLSFISPRYEYIEYCMEEYKKRTKHTPGAKPRRSLELAAKVEECLRKSENKISEIMKDHSGKFFTFSPDQSPTTKSKHNPNFEQGAINRSAIKTDPNQKK
jgi:hypothetical protein